MGTDCVSEACSLHDSFGPEDSDTLKTSTKDFSIAYGSGAVSGSLVNDTIEVAGMSLTYQFGLAHNTSSDFVHFAFDGILGMSMNSGANENFLSALEGAGLLDKSIFSVALARASDGHNDGEVTFGATNPSRYTGDITYTPIPSGTDWSIPLDDMSYNGKKGNVGGINAYIDTGTSYMFGPSKNVKALHAVIDGAKSSDGITWTVPCDTTTPLVVTFSGVDFAISPKDWISPKDSSGKCTSNVYGYEVVSGSWLFGDTFLKNVYAVFDKEQMRIGKLLESSKNSHYASALLTRSRIRQTFIQRCRQPEFRHGDKHGHRRCLCYCSQHRHRHLWSTVIGTANHGPGWPRDFRRSAAHPDHWLLGGCIASKWQRGSRFVYIAVPCSDGMKDYHAGCSLLRYWMLRSLPLYSFQIAK